MTDRKAVIKNADMSEEMQQDAVDCATQAMEKYNIEKDIAAYIKKVRRINESERCSFQQDYMMICTGSSCVSTWHLLIFTFPIKIFQ